MIEDYRVDPKSNSEIEAIACAWREAFGITETWAPDIATIIENSVPQRIPQFALIPRKDHFLKEAEAYTEFDPPRIVVRESVYLSAHRKEGRARFTMAHELGHLVMHPGAIKPRIHKGNQSEQVILPYESAEKQANRFAASFLMPWHIVMQFTNKEELAAMCQVSPTAAQHRYNEVFGDQRKQPECVAQLLRRLSPPK